ncbi:MAG: hypothetical protein IJ105_01260 [Bacilli bacterium]|nr:hypothetical protein [Bacilli bacterium]
MQKKTSLQELIKENHIKSNQEYVRRYEKAQKKDTILGYFVTAFIITIACVCISLYAKQSKEFIQTCTGKGYSVNYCMNHM